MSDSLDPTVLRAFCSVAEHGSLTRASAALEVGQSVLSRRIAALERDLGVPLFHRNGRGVIATEAAERLLPRARAILAETGALIEDARGERASPSGVVEIGLVPVVARPLVSALVQRLRRDYPRIRLRVTEGYTGQVEE
jgi:DNA-binding transcriptional LysR family regulator